MMRAAAFPVFSSPRTNLHFYASCSSPPTSQSPVPLLSQDLKTLDPRAGSGLQRRSSRSGRAIQCRSSRNGGTTSGPPGSGGESESKAILDAFFLGRAFAEAFNERVESTVGEFLSVIGQWQAEQQKQVMDFQEEVLERAKRAKEKAALEAMETQGLIPKQNSSSPTVPPTPNSANDDPLQDMLKE